MATSKQGGTSAAVSPIYDPDKVYEIKVNRVVQIATMPHSIFRPTATYKVKGAIATALGEAVAAATVIS